LDRLVVVAIYLRSAALSWELRRTRIGLSRQAEIPPTRVGSVGRASLL
jgi:hypothetical protein